MFKRNPNFARQLSEEGSYKQGLAAAAEPAAQAAKNFAPVRTGAYRDSIRVVSDGSGVRLEATDFKAWWIELGTATLPPQAPLRRGSQAAGLKFKASS